jgi:putative DNA primase/helicase
VVDPDGRTGWQAQKPHQFRAVPFFHSADPFDREVANDTIWWPEGEKDVEALSNQLLLAVTFGGTGDGLTHHNTPTKPQANSSAPLGVNFT